MAVFPYFGSIGYEAGHEYDEILRRYPNGAYRRYLKNSHNHKDIILEFNGVKQSIRDGVVNFFNARKSSVADFEFTFYNPEETSTIDPTGANATGRHTAYFPEQRLAPRRSGKCRWTFNVRIVMTN